MGAPGTPVVVAVCGLPGAGKTTVAAATARRLGVLLLTRDEVKVGLGLSGAAVASDGTVDLPPDFPVAGGPFSRRAEEVMVETARVLVAQRVSFVVESSVLSDDLVAALRSSGARVLAVHVVASPEVVDRRLQDRLAHGGPVAQQLASQFRRGEMARPIFEPPPDVDAVVELDTSLGGPPALAAIEAAVVALLPPGR